MSLRSPWTSGSLTLGHGLWWLLYLLLRSLLEVPDRPPNTLARFARDDPELGCGLLGAAGVTRQYGSTPLDMCVYVNLRRPPYWSYCEVGMAPYGL